MDPQNTIPEDLRKEAQAKLEALEAKVKRLSPNPDMMAEDMHEKKGPEPHTITEEEKQRLKAMLYDINSRPAILDPLEAATFAATMPAAWAPDLGDLWPWEPSNGRYWFNSLDERQRKEIAFAETYAEDYNHGTAGHNRLVLISQMSEALDGLQYRLNALESGGSGLVTPFTARKVLGVRYNPQWGYDANEHKKDCGPATLEMVGEYHATIDRTTNEIMRFITKGVDRPTNIAELQAAMRELYGLDLKRYNGASLTNLVEWIDAGRPIILLIWYGGLELRLDRGFTGGHFIVVVGYEKLTFEGDKWTRFIIHDPDYYSLSKKPGEYGARNLLAGAWLPITSEQLAYVWDNAHNAWNNPDNVALLV